VQDEAHEPQPGITLLEDLQVHEVSLVDRAANGRRFLIWKNAKGKNVKDSIQAVADTATDKEEAILQSVEKMAMSEDAQAALITAHRLIEGYSDEITDEMVQAFGLSPVAVEIEEEAAIQEPVDEPIAKAEEPEIEPVLKAANDRIAELENVLKSERDERILKADVERVSVDFGSIPGVIADELGQVLSELRKAAPDALAVIEKTLTRIATAQGAEASGLLGEAGKTTAVASTGSALDRIEGLVGERIVKGLDKSRAAAFATVTRLHPELYGEYAAERLNQ
tara:strand:+ start:883 stop:1725 length:843 start_codon:yes stop_codon:yes gene_type:complete